MQLKDTMLAAGPEEDPCFSQQAERLSLSVEGVKRLASDFVLLTMGTTRRFLSCPPWILKNMN